MLYYECMVMPFGLENAPSEFHKRMDENFKPCIKFVVVYIDDILFFSQTWKYHLAHI